MFNEQDWLKLLFLLNDTQNWLDEMCRETLYQLPVNEKRKFRRKSYYLTIPALAHILEKHYNKIARYPQAAKFTVTVIEILHYIRDAYSAPTSPVAGCSNHQRIIDTGRHIGYDRNGLSVQVLTIITDPGGKIITAFPGFAGASDISAMNKDEDMSMQEKESAVSNELP
jgi:hypothetical protein